ncbi:janus kinase and microtubule-interacting protein 1 isoform X3 [Patagioenas fasciata]|uniref:janus kinase and microtubule-interacting protein 1 isoform X3 n=1 Tax=Patagioenas fasciata TaxID=372321 RepID=UPI003A99ABE7
MVQYLQQKLESMFSGTRCCKHSDLEVMKLKTCIENVKHDVISHLEALQQNLKFFREKEEYDRREQADLLTELQYSQDTEDFLRRKLEESCRHVYSLKLSKIKLQEKMEELLDENKTLKDQGMVKFKKKKEKDSQFTRLENRGESVDLNGDLIQDDVQNLKWEAVLDSPKSRVTQTPVVLLRAKELETPGSSCDELKQMQELPEELLPVLEHNSSAFAKVVGLAETEQVTLGTKRAGALEDSFTFFRCTPSYCAARLFPPCSEKLTNGETSKETKDEENFSLLKEQGLSLPAKMFPVSVVEALMRKKLQLTLLEPESYHVSAVTTMKKVRSLYFCEANTSLCSDGLCFVAERGFSDKTSAHFCGKMPYILTEIFTVSLEKYHMEKPWENKQILPKSLSGNKSLDEVINDGKYHKKVFRQKAEGEEIQNEKAQPQQMTHVPEESSKVLNRTELIKPGKPGMEDKDSPSSPQDVQNSSVHFKDFKKHFEGNAELMDKQGNLSEVCISDTNKVYNREDIIKMENREQSQKPTHQTNPSSIIGLKEKKDQTLKLCEPNENNSSCQKIAAENMQYARSQNFLWSQEEKYPLNILSPVQERAVCLSKLFLSGSNFYECSCHLSPLEAGNDRNVKICALEKMVALCSQRIFLLMQENKNYSTKVCVLQQENERYAQMVHALEEEMDAYFQYILAVEEANIVSFQNLLNEKEVTGECYNNLSEENTVIPGTCFVETFSKNFLCLEEKGRNSEKESLTIASNTLSRSVLSLDGRKTRYFQLLSDLKEERSKCFKEIAQLLQDKENYVAKYNELLQERDGNLQRIYLLEDEKENLLGCLAEGSTFESYSVMKKQVEKAKEELQIQQKELEKSKKEAQKWYIELGFAETRYEEIKTHLTQALSELDRLKKEAGDKMLVKQHCKLMPVYTVKDGQEIEENKIAHKRLRQQVLTLKAQLRDQTALQNQFHDLQNEVELLQAQLCEKEKQIQKRKSEEKLALAPLKAKLACLTQKCQERNSFIARMLSELHRRGIITSAFDEEVKNFVNDVSLAEYTVAFTSMRDQEMLPSSTDLSQANGQPQDHETCIKIPSVVSSNSNLKADCNLPMIHKEAPWSVLSRMKDALMPLDHGAFWATKGRDQLSKCDDVFWGQIGNQHAGAIPQAMKQKNAIMNKAWLSREKTDGSTSATTAKSYLSDVLSASNKGRNPVGRNQLHGKELNPQK